jgi:hypothetical protein
MSRRRLISSLLLWTLLLGRASAHDPDEHTPSLACDEHAGESCYYAVIDDFHADPSTTDATGEVFLTLNSERTELRYSIVLDHLLGLKLDPADRTEPDDVIGMHLHLYVPGTVGPHVLNIFGLATYGVPAEEDADLVVDYEDRVLTGIYDISDATIDPTTGQPFPQNIPLTSKVITDWLGYLDSGLLMLAVHTNESGFPTMAIHGHISPMSRSVPEPATGMLAFAGIFAFQLVIRWRRLVGSHENRIPSRPNDHEQATP